MIVALSTTLGNQICSYRVAHLIINAVVIVENKISLGNLVLREVNAKSHIAFV